METHRVFIGAGSNLGDRMENLTLAGQLLTPAVSILRTSPVYQTQPWGYSDQPDFYNLVWEAQTTLPPQSLLSYLKGIERKMGREETFRYGPRVIDLDILLFDDLCYQSDNLTIPHPQMIKRRFVLQPLCELIPDEVDPQTGKDWRTLLAEAPEENVRKLPFSLDLSRKVIRWGVKTYLMGIINLTPDSFSGDGLLQGAGDPLESALRKASAFLEEGADILDVGAESTRPGFQPVTAEAERERLLPVIHRLRECYPAALLSVDTCKAAVAKAALDAGADWINDVGGGLKDAAMTRVAAETGAPIILMRWQPLSEEAETMPQVLREAESLATHALSAGVQRNRIILDPGIGFGTTPQQNLDILRDLAAFKKLGYPILLGTSRKSFIGHYLQKEVDRRLMGTAATVTAGIVSGVDIIRIHDVQYLADVIRMTDLICR